MASYIQQKNINLLRKFGITIEEYQAIYREQNGRCAICGKEENKVQRHFGKSAARSSLAVDHDHKTHRIRGLLCSNCNSALGFFNDDPELLIKAAEYLNSNRAGIESRNGNYSRNSLKRKQMEFSLEDR